MKNRPFITAGLIVLVVCLVFSNPHFVPGFLKNINSDLLVRLRGPRDMDHRLILIYLDETDIQALGGWPVTRDYYSYAIHRLTEANAQVIGLDILFSTPNTQYPEFDRMLSGFIESSRRVVLPDILENGGHDSIEPLPVFRRNAAGIGFSNLGEEAMVRSVPLVAGDSTRLSFGLALACRYLKAEAVRQKGGIALVSESGPQIRIPVDENGMMRLNPAGCIQRIRSLSFTSLLKSFENHPDSLDFSGQLVLIAVTAPSLLSLRATPLCSRLPASLIHATVAGNILSESWLKTASFPLYFLWTGFWTLAALRFCWKRLRGIGWILTLLTVVNAATAWLFMAAFQLVFPLILSTMFMWITGLMCHRMRDRDLYDIQAGRLAEIESRIRHKEEALTEAEERLSQAESRIHRETAEIIQMSEVSRRLIRVKEMVVLAIEKQIRDLKTFTEPVAVERPSQFEEIIHAPGSPLEKTLTLVEKVAGDDIPVLIQGETGTGKELIARMIHKLSRRSRKPFVAVNCGALSESLLESELFGHERGAFTGASGQRRGRFELAQGGTIFLDEITETSLVFQARLLRVLQEGTFERVGGERTLNADVRVIAAHNKNLPDEVESGRFREDLYFRLNAFPIDLPPLRDREDDIPALIEFFIDRYRKSGRISLSDAVMDRFRLHRWPGNVRELENVIRRSVLLAESEKRRMIQLKDLPEELQNPELDVQPALYQPLESQILETLRAFRFSHSAISQTAKALGNRDRGTITEYFRGLCFQYFVEHDDPGKAAAALAGSEDEEVVMRVERKIRDYLDNVGESVQDSPDSPSCYKGLPKKFHPFLDDIVQKIRNEKS